MTKTKILTTLAAAAALGLTAVAAPQPAQAGHWHGGGGAVAAGVIGGLAAGAIIGSAAANGRYYVAMVPAITLTLLARPITAAATGPASESGTAGAGACDVCVFVTKA